MKKLLYLMLALLVVASMCACFASCGGDETEDSTPSGSTGSTPTTESNPTDSGNGSGSTDSSGTTDSSNTTDSSGTTDSSTTDSSSSGSQGGDDVDDHTHTFAEEYSFDDENHYYAATCEHKNEKSGVEKHTYDLETGKCKCGSEKDPFDVVMGLILSGRENVTNGKAEYVSTYVETGTPTKTETEYLFYEDYLYVREIADYTNDYYFAINPKTNAVLGVMVQGGRANRNGDAGVDNLRGAEFILYCVDDTETSLFGTEELISYFYEYGKEKNNGDYVVSREENKYSFSYSNGDFGGGYYYCISASFVYDAEAGIMTEATLSVEKYSEGSYTFEDGVYTKLEGALPAYRNKYTISQNNEQLKYEPNPYDPAKVLVESLVVSNSSGENIEEIEYDIPYGNVLEFFFSEITPSTAMLELCDIQISLVNVDNGRELTGYFPYYRGDSKSYMFSISTPGKYTMTVTVNDEEYVTVVNAGYKKPSTISSQVYNPAYEEFEASKETTVYVGTPLYFSSLVSDIEDGAYSVAFSGGMGAESATLEEAIIKGKAATMFKASEAGTYVVEISSTVATGKNCNLVIHVVEAPTLGDILYGTYKGIDESGKSPLVLTFDTEAKTIHLELTDYGETFTSVISYSYEGTEISFEYVSGDDIITDFYLTENYELIMILYDEYVFTLESANEPVELVSTGALTVENAGSTTEYKYEYYSNGAFRFFKDGNVTSEISLVLEEGIYTVVYGGREQYLYKIEGNEEELTGKYELDSSDAIITIVDDNEKPLNCKGTLALVDKISSGLDSSYTGSYYFVCVDGIFTFYKDGEVTTDIQLTIEGEEYMLSFPAVASKLPLTRTSGEEGSLEGKYNVVYGGVGILVATVTIDIEEEKEEIPVDEVVVTVLGVQNVQVNDADLGTNLIFTAGAAGTYEIQLYIAEKNGELYLVNGEALEEITGKYEFTLAAGETIVFNIKTVNGEAGTVKVILQSKANEPPKAETDDDEF